MKNLNIICIEKDKTMKKMAFCAK